MTLTIDNATSKALTETIDGITMPADTSFATVNHFVNSHGVNFEELQALCLGLASELDKLKRGEFICNKCWRRKDGEGPPATF